MTVSLDAAARPTTSFGEVRPPAAPSLSGERPVPPSFPTCRSRVLRDGLFAASVAAYAAAMYAIAARSAAEALPAQAAEISVFTDAFEPDLRMRVAVRVPGVEFRGEAERRTEFPYEGRAVVRETARAEGTSMGTALILEIDSKTHWDRALGFRMAETKVRLLVPGFASLDVSSKTARSGDKVTVTTALPGGAQPRVRRFRVPKGVDLSAGVMEPARVRPVEVGVRWTVRALGLSGEVAECPVEVVEYGRVPLSSGPETYGFRATMKVETATGRFRDMPTWYDVDGRALMQTVSLGPVDAVFERVERLRPGRRE